MLSVKSLKVECIAVVLQELSIRVNKGVCPFSKAMVDVIWVVPHLLDLSFAQIIIGLVINQNHITFAKGVRVDMGFVMGF